MLSRMVFCSWRRSVPEAVVILTSSKNFDTLMVMDVLLG